MRVLVIGAGVAGLTVGVTLAEAGHQVDVLARELPQETTSAVAAAIWYPYLAEPAERVLAWSRHSKTVFEQLAETPATGVVLSRGTELLRSQSSDPWWIEAVPDLRRLVDTPAPYADGWSFTTPVIEMPVYLEWLRRRLEDAGATLTRMALPALPDRAGLVVNCAGLGARMLADDPSVYPVRGQVVRVSQVGISEWMLDEAGITYIVPRSHDVIVGGTEERGDWNMRPDPAVAEQILLRASALVPEIADAEVLGHRVGLRPARPEVRLELDERDDHSVIHCYGLGGAGVTLSWGCAAEVAALAERVKARHHVG